MKNVMVMGDDILVIKMMIKNNNMIIFKDDGDEPSTEGVLQHYNRQQQPRRPTVSQLLPVLQTNKLAIEKVYFSYSFHSSSQSVISVFLSVS